ncbi:MAG: divergent PAP2 family protein [Clostridiales bacterium]|nr:divergent PAP2 family protein [Clostridiales bacterium]
MSILSWLAAQLIKVLIALFITRKFELERLVGSGGMPSSHSALVCGLATSVFIRHGVTSYEFAIAAVLALIVMYDAMGVRRAAGEQAKTINKLVNWYVFDQKNEEESPPEVEPDKMLKELIGHTPIEVISGALLGIGLVTLVSL